MCPPQRDNTSPNGGDPLERRDEIADVGVAGRVTREVATDVRRACAEALLNFVGAFRGCANDAVSPDHLVGDEPAHLAVLTQLRQLV